MPDISDMIRFAAENNPVAFQDAFERAIADKVVAAVDAKRIEVAQNYFAPSYQNTEEPE